MTLTNDGNGKLTASGTSTAGGNHYFFSSKQVLSGHKYLVSVGSLTSNAAATLYLRDTTNASNIVAINIQDLRSNYYAIGQSQYSGNASYYLNYGGSGRAISGVIYPMVIDLTLALGSTVADYIYTLENTSPNPGLGVAWLHERGYFTKPYYSYDAGSLQSVNNLSRHETLGVNQWDEEWEVGTINNNTGANVSDNTHIRSKNYIHVIDGLTYFIRGARITWVEYDANQVYLRVGGGGSFVGADATFTPSSDAAYIRFYTASAYGTTYNHDICINIANQAVNGTYYPYNKRSYSLDSSLTLRGIPKLDADNKLYYDGDTYESDGTVTRYWGVRAYQAGDTSNGSTMITDGTNTVYKLAAPTTETAMTYSSGMACNSYGTEEFVSSSTIFVPPYAPSEYQKYTIADVGNGSWLSKEQLNSNFFAWNNGKVSVNYATNAGVATSATNAQKLCDNMDLPLTVGSSSAPVWFSNGVPTVCTSLPSAPTITLNGSVTTTPTFYAPTSAASSDG